MPLPEVKWTFEGKWAGDLINTGVSVCKKEGYTDFEPMNVVEIIAAFGQMQSRIFVLEAILGRVHKVTKDFD